MLISQGLELAASQHHVAHTYYEAGVLRAVRKAVEAVIAIVFVVGLFLGFLLGRFVGRRQK